MRYAVGFCGDGHRNSSYYHKNHAHLKQIIFQSCFSLYVNNQQPVEQGEDIEFIFNDPSNRESDKYNDEGIENLENKQFGRNFMTIKAKGDESACFELPYAKFYSVSAIIF